MKTLYDFPRVYDALRTVEDDVIEGLLGVAARHGVPDPRSVMDPACGPGNCLVPFAQRGLLVAGNDLAAPMVEEARRRLAPHNGHAEIVQGDMRRPVFRSGPYDLAVEIGGASAHLRTLADLRDHLRGVAACLRPGGLFLVMLFPRRAALVPVGGPPGAAGGEAEACWRSGPCPVPGGGSASVTYFAACCPVDPRFEVLRRAVSVRGVEGCPGTLEEEYRVRTWNEEELADLRGGGDATLPLTLDGCYAAGGSESWVEVQPPEAGEHHEVLAVFRRS